MRAPKGSGIKILRREFDFLCMCGGTATIVRDEEGVPAVVHDTPACLDFLRLEPEDYVAVVRLSRAPAKGGIS